MKPTPVLCFIVCVFLILGSVTILHEMDWRGSLYMYVTPTNYTHTTESSKSPVIRILYWTQDSASATRWKRPVWGFGSERFKNCSVSQCEATSNRSLLNSSDVIFINPRVLGVHVASHLPKYRNPHQVWLLNTYESPKSYSIPKLLHGLFNATYTYKLTSDVKMTRWTVEDGGQVGGMGNATMVQPNGQPKKLVAWVVSACKSRNQREKYVEMLQNYIQVDIYGECGKLKCPEDKSKSRFTRDNPCHTMIASMYLFYLAFENSSCEDYVTEKVLRTLQLGIIPIVYGRAKYKRIMPPHSFIDIQDFHSVKDLAEYLKLLSQNPKLYESYFEWKLNYHLGSMVNACHACEALHNLQSKLPQVVDVQKFWGVEENCDDGSWMYK